MGRRQQQRVRVAVPVTVALLDAEGQRSVQPASTVEVSWRGVRLRGLRGLRAPGVVIELEYQQRRAQYRVAWIGKEGTCYEGQAGLESVADRVFLFAEYLVPSALNGPPALTEERPAIATEDHAAVERRETERRLADRRQDERRRFPRFNCAGSARVWENGSEHAVQGRMNEISLGGCYVEMWSPLRSGGLVRVEIQVCQRTVKLQGIVRASMANAGMGIEFHDVPQAEWKKLEEIISELKGEIAPQVLAPSAPPSSAEQDPEQVANAVLRWFATHDELSRSDFLKITSFPVEEHAQV
ncbi:MAG: PilZ domain-containing protein [Terriglobales bacterium]